MSLFGLDRDENARVPLVYEPEKPVSAPVLHQLRDDLLRRHRRAFLAASPLLIVAGIGWAAAIANPRAYGGFAMLSFMIVLLVGHQGYEWWKLRRANPVALYEREQREAAERREDLIAHEARSAEILPLASIALTGTVVVVTAVQFLFAPGAIWLEAGALVKPAVKAGEWWRLLTCTYLHGNLVHISSNAGGLFALARLIETYDRRMRVPLVYLMSAFSGSLLSTALLSAPSLGASGGVLGLAGYLVAVGRRQGSPLPPWIRRQLLSTVGLTALLGGVAFFLIDNAAHGGGALAGAALGWALPLGQSSDRRDTADVLGAISALVLAAGALFTIARLLRLL
jgi:membrane associated rhomboid family serine protease